MLAYKLVRVKDGKFYPLFINRNVEIPVGEWLTAEKHVTKGYAVRVGWHCTLKPCAPHLKMVLANGEQRVWVKVEVNEWSPFVRPESQGGTWVLAQKMMVIGNV